MKVSEINRRLFKCNLTIYLSDDRTFWERKEKAGFSERLSLIELAHHAELYKVGASGNSLTKFLDKDVLYAGVINAPGLLENMIVIEK